MLDLLFLSFFFAVATTYLLLQRFLHQEERRNPDFSHSPNPPSASLQNRQLIVPRSTFSISPSSPTIKDPAFNDSNRNSPIAASRSAPVNPPTPFLDANLLLPRYPVAGNISTLQVPLLPAPEPLPLLQWPKDPDGVLSVPPLRQSDFLQRQLERCNSGNFHASLRTVSNLDTSSLELPPILIPKKKRSDLKQTKRAIISPIPPSPSKQTKRAIISPIPPSPSKHLKRSFPTPNSSKSTKRPRRKCAREIDYNVDRLLDRLGVGDSSIAGYGSNEEDRLADENEDDRLAAEAFCPLKSSSKNSSN